MKNTIILLFLLPVALFAQVTLDQGTVIYEQVIEMEIDMANLPEGMGDMAKLFPKEQRFKKQLNFNSSVSLFRNYAAEEVEDEGADGNMRVIMAQNEDETFTDFKKKRVVEKKSFFGRTFLIEDKPEKLAWKLTGEKKEILGYACMKAISIKDSAETVAWFTPAIPISTGPENAGLQLPGLVLEMTVDDGNITYTALSLDLKKVGKSDLAQPKTGKSVTREAYDAIVKAKIEEMQEQFGGKGQQRGGSQVIMIR
ncbi:MAG TPA: GLPGLI family protein [Bacteroidetes bacterium]|nr:GLPGLI family protein [Bacteroidota bacterium]